MRFRANSVEILYQERTVSDPPAIRRQGAIQRRKGRGRCCGGIRRAL